MPGLRLSGLEVLSSVHEARRGAGPIRLQHPDPASTIRRRFDRPLPAGWYKLDIAFSSAGLVSLLVDLVFADGQRLVQRLPVLSRNRFGGHLRLPAGVVEIVLHRQGSNAAEPVHVVVGESRPLDRAREFLGRAFQVLRDHPRDFLKRAVRFALRIGQNNPSFAPVAGATAVVGSDYERWRELFDEHPERDIALHRSRLDRLTRRPVFSVITVLTEPGADPEAVIAGCCAQIYPGWELILVTPEDGIPPTPADDRIRHCRALGRDRSAALNAALERATGMFVVALAPNARLRPHALLECALALEAFPSTKLLYADEDTLGPGGARRSPCFKPAWSPDVARTHDYIGNAAWLQTEALRALGGWRANLEGAEDHDLKLRLADRAGPEAIVHIAQVLLHMEERVSTELPDKSAPAVVADHLERNGLNGRVLQDPRSPHLRVVHALPSPPPLVSFIIPTRDRADLLRTCVTSILERTRYPAYEIIIVDNGSTEQTALALFESWRNELRIRVLPQPGPFNYSALNNEAVRQARGDILALVNNDVEVTSADWLEEMVGFAAQPRIGCVGAKLVYPDGSLQHGGVVVGVGGVAGHGHKHASPGATGYLDRLVTVTNVSAVTGACLVVRKDVYEQVGGLDENLFRVAFNDVDLCLKVAAAGYLNIWTPFAELIHHESISRGKELTPQKARRFASEVLAFRQKWGAQGLSDPYYSPHLNQDGEDYGVRVR
jgi:O-antigen biosynthesis protein